jgi:UDP-N-acetylmuramoyl-tripeptide--D-alanyl-D-alanine ligase
MPSAKISGNNGKSYGPMFTAAEIVRATHGKLAGKADGMVSGVSTDSRTVTAEELFVALKGERFDGHDFIPVAAGRGVRFFLVEEGWRAGSEIPADALLIKVADTLKAFGDLAAFHRSRFSLQVTGVTGSNGKTTTKEMLARILALTGPGLKTSGNLNNLIGLPQMLLQLNEQHKWAILEMGMSELGEIDRLAEIARPDTGIITNALPAHLETLGSVEAVARAKGELFLRLSAGACAVYNADDPLISVAPSPEGVRRLSFGLGKAEVRAEAISSLGRKGQLFTLCLPSGSHAVTLKAFGTHNVYNALAAAAAAFAMDIDPLVIVAGLESFAPYDKRFSLEELGPVTLIDDSYNANPGSMRAALTTLRDLKAPGRGIAVLGDMLELGEGAGAAHRELGSLAASCVDRLYIMGDMAEIVASGALTGGLAPNAVVTARNHGEILADLQSNLTEGDYILIKGSRGMRMEVVAEGIRNVYGSYSKKEAVV